MTEAPVISKPSNLLWDKSMQCRSVIWSPDSTSFLANDWCGKVTSFNPDGNKLWEHDMHDNCITNYQRFVCEYSIDSSLVICKYRGGSVDILNARNGKIVLSVKLDGIDHMDFDVTLSPDSSRLVTVSNNIIRMWSVPGLPWLERSRWI